MFREHRALPEAEFATLLNLHGQLDKSHHTKLRGYRDRAEHLWVAALSIPQKRKTRISVKDGKHHIDLHSLTLGRRTVYKDTELRQAAAAEFFSILHQF